MSDEQPNDLVEEIRYEVDVPAGIAPGVPCDYVSVWHTEHSFTLDFHVLDSARARVDGHIGYLPTHLVARVKLPTTLIFALIKAIGDNLDKYETKFGPVHGAGRAARDQPE